MKAKEYFDRFEKEGRSRESLGKIGKDFLMEMQTIREARHVGTGPGYAAIIREFDQKWRAFCRLANDTSVSPEGFLKLVAYAYQIPIDILHKIVEYTPTKIVTS